MPYPDAANPDLLDRIPLTARTVLDVGCGSAALGLEYKRRNPLARYFGVESDPEACILAAGRIDHVVGADVEAVAFPFGEQRFDCIIYGDLLEHLKDPWKLLALHATRLQPGGLVLICMPNVEHWSFVQKLLAGSWAYEEQGLLDHSHLRWFSAGTMLSAFAGAGLKPHDVSPRIFDADGCNAFVTAMAPSLRLMGIDPQEYAVRAAPIQHVWRALAEPVDRLNIVSTMLDPVGGVSHARIIQPMRALSTLPELLCLITKAGEVPALAADSVRIFIFHRPALIGPETLRPIRQLLALGFVVVTEFDDHPDYIPILQQPDVQNFRAVHAVQTSTAPLAEVLAQRNPEVAVFPNAIERIPPHRNFEDPGRITLFFGGLNREQDWPEWLPVLNEVIAQVRAEGRVQLRFCVVSDRGLFEGLATDLKVFTPLCDYDTYLDLLSRCEISFMPLGDSVFNRCKSDLKFLEAAAARVMALASPTVYAASIEDGRTGLIFRDAAELRRKLLAVVADPGQARAMAEAARRHVAERRMLAYQLADRVAWYRDLWSRRHALNRALLTRVPELANAPSPMAELPSDLGRVMILRPAAAATE